MLSNLVPVMIMSLVSPDPPPPVQVQPPDSVAPSDVAVRVPSVQLPASQRSLTEGFGAAVTNKEKLAKGVRCNDQPLCTNPAHMKKGGVSRQKAQCRPCLKEMVETIPASATRWQTSRYLTALFRNYFCPFCFLECDRGLMHKVTVKSKCKNHCNINRMSTCQHGKEWHFCTDCPHDPRSATRYCACGNMHTEKGTFCSCSSGLKNLSYGVRFGTNPFVVPTDDVRVQEDLWASESLARAALLQLSGEEIPRAKKRRVVAPADV